MPAIPDRILDSAATLILEKGIDHASLRAIAARADVSLGAIDHHWGGRRHLLDAVIARAAIDHAGLVARCLDHLRAFIPLAPSVATSVARRWLTDAEPVARRTALLASAFLAQDARTGIPSAGLVAIIEQERRLWQALFEGHPQAERHGTAMAAYLRDERPFALLLEDDPHYPILRDITLRRAACDFPCGAPVDPAFATVVAAIAEGTRPVAAHRAPKTGTRAAELAAHIASVIVEEGTAAVTHRRVAQAAAAPPSSVAHHFPGRRDLIQAGVDALYLRMWHAIAQEAPNRDDHGRAVIRLTHDLAVAARHEPAFRLFAHDMRRRRAENVQAQLGADGFDPATGQALIMALHGEMLAVQASGNTPCSPQEWLAPYWTAIAKK
ncbi:helix-turn-helix domain-containing protein [Sphingomonadaceae bacterium jetA1]|jgi:AcrR family transcriptional regulator|uniref:TetR family transcriptional regulator n=1 Tax=Facivitalis istanbulensis TaxID=3075838 RepID=UPI0034992343